MRNEPFQPAEDAESQPNSDFARDLATIYGPGPTPPADFDARLHAAARHHFARRRRRLWLRLAPLPAAAAAAILLAIAFWPQAPQHAEQSALNRLAAAPETAHDPEDLNADGQVDILDAYALARRLHRGDAVSANWDFNADGTVDRRDADVIALAAVRLDRG